MSALYEAEGMESGTALESKTGKEEWLSQTDSMRGNKTIIYENKLTK